MAVGPPPWPQWPCIGGLVSSDRHELPWVQLESCWLPLRYSCNYCILRVSLPCCSLLWLMGIIAVGLLVDSLLKACMVPSPLLLLRFCLAWVYAGLVHSQLPWTEFMFDCRVIRRYCFFLVIPCLRLSNLLSPSLTMISEPWVYNIMSHSGVHIFQAHIFYILSPCISYHLLQKESSLMRIDRFTNLWI